MPFRPTIAAVLVAVCAAGPVSSARADEVRKPRKVAFLVGPSTYLYGFDPLKYTARDVTQMAAEFRAAGFDEVVVLTDPPEGKSPATRQNVLDRLERLVSKQPREADNVRRGDLVVVVLSGHGIELEVPDPADPGKKRWEAFFVPVDGRRGQPDTLVGIGRLVNEVLEPCGGQNLLLVDACRELYQPNKGKGVGNGQVALKGEAAILFSCSANEKSWESATVEHGVFTYAVLEVLRGRRERKEALHWTHLVAGVQDRLQSPAYRKYLPDGITQTPVLAAGELRRIELLPGRDPDEPRRGESEYGSGTVKPDAGGGVKPPVKPPVKAALVVGGRAVVKPQSGAEAIATRSNARGDDQLGVPRLEKGTVVKVLSDPAAQTCEVSWSAGGKTWTGWVPVSDLVAVPNE